MDPAPDTHQIPIDYDAEKRAANRPPRISINPELMEASALLLLWSVLVINEGSIRLLLQRPFKALTDSARPPKIVPFLGGLFEVAFGLLGVAVSAAAFLPRKHSQAFTKLSMIVQTLLGYYVFVVFVFMLPAYRSVDLTEPIVPGLSISESRTIITMGILTSFHFCLALQGGQFVFLARMIVAASGQDFLKQKSGNQMRSVFWNCNLALAGLWTIITGAIIHSSVGGGELDAVYLSPPNVGRLPLMTIFTGLAMLAWGGLGASLGVMRKAPMFYFIGCFVVYVFALLNYGIVQFGLIDSPPSPVWPTPMHNGLVFMVTFIGPYFVMKSADESNKAEEE